MWRRIRGSATCGMCDAVTPVNAANPEIECVECGAVLSLGEELWQGALPQVVAAELASNELTHLVYEAQDAELRLEVGAIDPSCPHCDAAWAEMPGDSCPSCGNDLCSRPRYAYTLIAEDRGGVSTSSDGESIDCRGCGSPVAVVGDARLLRCGHCDKETVIPDPLWRRLHAPSAVATWWLYLSGDNTLKSLGRISGVTGLAADGQHVFMLCMYRDTFCLLALEDHSVAWMVDLGDMYVFLSLGSGEVSVCKFGSRKLRRFSAATGEELEGFKLPAAASSLGAAGEGSWLVGSPRGLVRADRSGTKIATWPGRSWLKSLFSRGAGPLFEETTVAFRSGHDGDLRVASGARLARVQGNGSVSWSLLVPGANVATSPPDSAADGTTYGVFRTVGGTMTVDDVLAFTERMADGETESSSSLFKVDAEGRSVTVVRASGPEEFVAMAVEPGGAVWLSRGQDLLHLGPSGELLWQHR